MNEIRKVTWFEKKSPDGTDNTHYGLIVPENPDDSRPGRHWFYATVTRDRISNKWNGTLFSFDKTQIGIVDRSDNLDVVKEKVETFLHDYIQKHYVTVSKTGNVIPVELSWIDCCEKQPFGEEVLSKCKGPLWNGQIVRSVKDPKSIILYFMFTELNHLYSIQNNWNFQIYASVEEAKQAAERFFMSTLFSAFLQEKENDSLEKLQDIIIQEDSQYEESCDTNLV